MLRIYTVWVSLLIGLLAGELVGKVDGELEVIEGKSVYTVPIAVHKDPFGLTPRVALRYIQGGANDIAGVGFALQAHSSITRCGDTDLIEEVHGGLSFDQNAKYCLNGTRMIETSPSSYVLYGDPKVRITRIGDTADPQSWRVEYANGIIELYGETPQSLDTLNQGVIGWYLTSRKDRLGHTSTYRYRTQNTNTMPILDTIEYNRYKILFLYETRPDVHEDYVLGKKRIHDLRLSSIEYRTQAGDLIHSYKIGYDPLSQDMQSSRISQIELCDASNQCTNPVVFKYAKTQGEPIEHTTAIKVDTPLNYSVVDIDNDGLNDICYYDGTNVACGINDGSGNTSQNIRIMTNALQSDDDNIKNAYSASMLFLDLNRDGFSDLCVADESGVKCLLNGGNSLQTSSFQTDQITITDPFRFIDINFDNLPDLCRFDSEGLSCMRNTGSRFGTLQPITDVSGQMALEQNFTHWSFSKQEDSFFRPVFPDDPAYAPQTCEAGPIYQDGVAFYCDVQQQSAKIPQPTLIDINADGNIDICGFDTDVTRFSCALGKGRSPTTKEPLFEQPTQWAQGFPVGDSRKVYKTLYTIGKTPPADPTEADRNVTERFNRSFRFVDLNNDALPDMCYLKEKTLECRINTGAGFEEPKAYYTFSENLQDHNEATLQFADANGDGRKDLIYYLESNIVIALNESSKRFIKSDTFLAFPDIQADENRTVAYTRPIKKWFGLKTEFITALSALAYGPVKIISDTDTKRNIEICYRSLEGIGCIRKEKAPLSLLERIIDSNGLRSEIFYDHTFFARENVPAYDPFVSDIDTNDLFSDEKIYRHTHDFVVTKVQTQTANGETNSLLYDYGPIVSDDQGRVLGFSSVTVSDPQRNTSTRTGYIRRYGLLNGKVDIIQTRYNDNLYEEKRINYTNYIPDSVTVNGDKSNEFIIPTAVYTTRYDPLRGDVLWHRYEGYTYDSSYGNLLSKTDTTNEIQTQNVKTTEVSYAYPSDELLRFLAKPESIRTTNTLNGESVVKTARFTYDASGRILSQTLGANDTLPVHTYYTYDGTSTHQTKTVVSGDIERKSETFYDEYGRVVKEVNALGHTTQIDYDDRCNAPSKITDPNGLQRTFAYDSLCRKSKEILPDETVYSYTLRFVDFVDIRKPGGAENIEAYSELSVHKNGRLQKRTYADRSDRTVREVRYDGEDNEVYIDYFYDRFGNKAGETLPYYAQTGLSDDIDRAWLNAQWIRYAYDDLGRLTTKTAPTPNGEKSVTYSYSGLSTVVTSPKWHRKTLTKDAAGNIVKVEESDGSILVYRYTPSGKLKEVERNDNVVLSATYDAFDRKTSVTDVASGTTEFEYNGLGELIKKTDAQGNVITYAYDAIGRIVEKKSAQETTRYTYDNAPGASVGKLSEITKAQITKRFVYDDVGRLIEKRTIIEGKEFTDRYRYDEKGRVASRKFPSNLDVNYTYMADDTLESIKVAENEIWDVDYVNIEKAYLQAASTITSMQKRIADAEDKIRYYVQKAEELRALAKEYAKHIDPKSKQLQAINEARKSIEALVNAYQSKYNALRELSNRYVNRYKNLVFNYLKTQNGMHYYSYQRCVDKNWKGHCKRYATYTVAIPTWASGTRNVTTETVERDNPANQTSPVPEVNENYLFGTCVYTPLGEKTIVSSSKWGGTTYTTKYVYKRECDWGPKRSLNVSQTLVQEANYYDRLLKQEQAKLNANTAQARQIQEEIDALVKKRDQALNDAKYYAQRAKEENAAIRDYIQKIEAAKKQQESAQEQLAQREQNTNVFTLYKVLTRAPSGQIASEYFGNGYMSRRHYDPYGAITRITTGIADNLIQDISYEYDDEMLISSKIDAIANTQENYTYDTMNRLVSWSLQGAQGQIDREYAYDENGNMTFKSGIGSMSYDQNDRLVQAGNYSDFTYDEAGRMLTGRGIRYRYNAYGQVEQIIEGATEVNFTYDESEKWMIKSFDDGTKVYRIDDDFEVRITPTLRGEEIKMIHHLIVEGKKRLTYTRTLYENEPRVDQTAYLHPDAQGSFTLITDSKGNVLSRNRYTPYGESIGKDLSSELEDRIGGYSGAKGIRDFSVWDMNARVYDPILGRFSAPDTIIPDPHSAVGFNRYAYVYNNPVNYTDPSGHSPLLFFIGAALFTISITTDDPTVSIITGAVGNAMMMRADIGITNGFVQGGLVGFSQGFIASAGRVDTAFSEGLFRMFSAAIAFSVGEITGHDLSFSNLLAHGISQGAIAPIRGGSFRSGFISAIISKLSGAVVSKIDTEVEGYDKILSGSIVALFGGLGSEATGGSFQEGAMRALAVYLFNDMAQTYPDKDEMINGLQAKELSRIHRAVAMMQQSKGIRGIKWGADLTYVEAYKRVLQIEAFNKTAEKALVAGAVGIALTPVVEMGYMYAIANPEVIAIGTELVIGALDANPPTNFYQNVGYLFNRYIVSPITDK